MIKLLLAFFLAVVIPSDGENAAVITHVSPCPDVLSYEQRTDPNSDRWFATISFPASSNPYWLFITVVLDMKVDMLGNYLGHVTTHDNIDFKINNPEREVKKRRGPILRFFVKHERDLDVLPKVQIIRLDGVEICNADNPVSPVKTPAPTIAAPIVTSTTLFRTPPTIDVTRPPPSAAPMIEGECGKVKLNNPIALVSNGLPTLEGQWPWQIALYRTERVNQHFICGGTLVSSKHVITAAHCTTERNSNPFQPFDESTLTVYLGKHNLVTSVYGAQVRFVDKITVHPDYKSRIFTRDLSILLLQEPARYTQWVQPACLWPEHLIDKKHIVGTRGSVVGWGNDGSGLLKLVLMPVVDQETCIRSKGDFFLRFTSDYTYCAGFRDGRSPCNGDSGGGMVFKIGESWYLRGVVSLSLSRDNEPVCDPEQFVVFTDVAQFLPWIRQNMED